MEPNGPVPSRVHLVPFAVLTIYMLHNIVTGYSMRILGCIIVTVQYTSMWSLKLNLYEFAILVKVQTTAFLLCHSIK